eukprot:PhM_4_TR15772/c0_g1_i1/m.42039
MTASTTTATSVECTLSAYNVHASVRCHVHSNLAAVPLKGLAMRLWNSVYTSAGVATTKTTTTATSASSSIARVDTLYIRDPARLDGVVRIFSPQTNHKNVWRVSAIGCSSVEEARRTLLIAGRRICFALGDVEGLESAIDFSVHDVHLTCTFEPFTSAISSTARRLKLHAVYDLLCDTAKTNQWMPWLKSFRYFPEAAGTKAVHFTMEIVTNNNNNIDDNNNNNNVITVTSRLYETGTVVMVVAKLVVM